MDGSQLSIDGWDRRIYGIDEWLLMDRWMDG